MWGVTQLRGAIYIICEGSPTITRFSATTHQQLADIKVQDLSQPWDIAACERTSRMYVADWNGESVWRVASDGSDIEVKPILWILSISGRSAYIS